MFKIVKNKNEDMAQVMIEFTFCVIVVFIMMYSLIKVFQWTGVDMVERRIAHEKVLKQEGSGRGNTLDQITPNFYVPVSLNAAWSYGRW